MFIEAVGEEIAKLEAEAIDVAPWVGKTKNGTAEYDGKVKEITRRKDMLALLESYAAESYQWVTVTLTP